MPRVSVSEFMTMLTPDAEVDPLALRLYLHNLIDSLTDDALRHCGELLRLLFPPLPPEP